MLELRTDSFVLLGRVHVHEREDVGLDVLLVALAHLAGEGADLLAVCEDVVILLVVLLVPTRVDDGFQQAHGAQAHFLVVQGLAIWS